MSNTEDYLDSLLNNINSENMTEKSQSQKGEEEHQHEVNFLKEFEGELEGEDADDFLRQFELELEPEKDNPLEVDLEKEQGFFENIEGIVQSVSKEEASNKSQDADLEEENQSPELPLEDLSEETESPEEKSEEAELEYVTEEEMGEETGDDELLNFLSDMQNDEDISEIGDLLKADQENIELEESGLEALEEETNQSDKDSDAVQEEKPVVKEKKKGLLKKIADVLFGAEEEIEKSKVQEEVVVPEVGDLENISEENLQILKELETVEQAAQEEPEGKKEKKKREKKPKKEKEPKEKKERKKRERKPKPPKEKDNTPALPKKPVILIFLMAASIIVLILLMSNSVGYSSNISEAKDAMDNAEYTKAYKELAGLDLKTADMKLYKKAEVMASVQAQYDSYLTLMSANEYDLALDALIRGIGRYDAKLSTAKKYGLEKQLNVIEVQIEEALDAQFDLTAEDARELYSIKKRKDYSVQIHKIIQELNIGQVEE